MDPRALRIWQICLGLLLIADVWGRWPYLNLFYGPQGMAPLALWLERLGSFPAWSVFWYLPSGVTAYQTAAVGQVIAGLALMAGVLPRLAALVAWVFVMSWQRRNPLVSYGADPWLALQLLWCALLGPRPGRALSVMWLLQWVCVYVFAAWAKAQRMSWRTGEAVGFILGASPHSQWAELAQYPFLIKAFTWGTLALESLVALAVLFCFPKRPLRGVLLLLIMAFHGAIVPLLGLGFFSAVSIAACLSLWGFGGGLTRPDRQNPLLKLAAAMMICGALGTNLAAVDSPLRTLWTRHLPVAFNTGWAALGVQQSWRMFSDAWPDPVTPRFRLTAAAGSTVPEELEDFLGSVRGITAARAVRKPWFSFAGPLALEGLCHEGAPRLSRAELWEKDKLVFRRDCAP